MRLCLFGHMTVWVEIDGVCLLTDPWFGPHERLERCLAPRSVPPAVSAEALARVQAILVSHHHLDHLDKLALRLARLLRWTVVGSQTVARLARQAGVAEVVGLRPHQSVSIGAVCIDAVPAEHPLAADAIGFLVRGTRSLYFSGDTRCTQRIVEAVPSQTIDVALLQAACAHYPFFGDDGMALAEAASFVRALRPRWFVPLHLHCSGKWLDRQAGLRLGADNDSQVRAALTRWLAGLAAEGLRGRLLDPGEYWDVEAEE